MHQVADYAAMEDIVDLRREAGKRGFLVRADTKKHAQQRLKEFTITPQTVSDFYIL